MGDVGREVKIWIYILTLGLSGSGPRIHIDMIYKKHNKDPLRGRFRSPRPRIRKQVRRTEVSGGEVKVRCGNMRWGEAGQREGIDGITPGLWVSGKLTFAPYTPQTIIIALVGCMWVMSI